MIVEIAFGLFRKRDEIFFDKSVEHPGYQPCHVDDKQSLDGLIDGRFRCCRECEIL